ncbi:MAG TPA: 30S ribosome-binding factor RbfA [Polyangiaceae bacterium]
MGEVKRSARVAEGLMQELAVQIGQHLRDPRVKNTVVSRVELTDDLRTARVYVRALEGSEDKARNDAILEGLAKAAGVLRRQATKALKLRVAPELTFFYDDGLDKRTRIDSLLLEIEHENREKKKKG